jgi:hypothetical protein
MNQAQTILFNLNNLSSIATVTHKCAVIVDTDGNPLAGFEMVGKNSAQYREVQRQLRVEGLQRSAKRKEAVDTSTPDGAAVVIEAVDSSNLRTACAVITGWFGFGDGTNPAPFDASKLESIFTQMPTWKDQVLADLDKEANFMPSSSNA